MQGFPSLKRAAFPTDLKTSQSATGGCGRSFLQDAPPIPDVFFSEKKRRIEQENKDMFGI